MLSVPPVGLLCKAFLASPLCTVRVTGLSLLAAALEDAQRRADGRGVITVCNHISTLDDPLTWGILPARYFFNSKTTRWALGASDVMFTNPVFSWFFSHGQTLETFRGKGVYQPAVDTAIRQLDQGGWVHLFGEGKINQSNTYPRDLDGLARLPRFKWGVGRIMMETQTPPVVIPMWLSGFDQLMPEGRSFPWKYLPKIGVRLSVTIGQPISPARIRDALDVGSIIGANAPDPSSLGKAVDGKAQERLTGWLGEEAVERLDAVGVKNAEPRYAPIIRQRVTAVIHDEVEALGRAVSGPLLSSHSPSDLPLDSSNSNDPKT